MHGPCTIQTQPMEGEGAGRGQGSCTEMRMLSRVQAEEMQEAVNGAGW